MLQRDIETILGLPCPEVTSHDTSHLFCELGDGVEPLGSARTIEGAFTILRDRAFREGAPAFASEDVAGRTEAPEWATLAHALSDDLLMNRTFAERDLVYLSSVVDERPDLALLVAWEAAPPHQDAAFGIFVPHAGR